MNPWVLDLCSGLGGASEAFVKDPYWDVVRIENNPELAHVPHGVFRRSTMDGLASMSIRFDG